MSADAVLKELHTRDVGCQVKTDRFICCPSNGLTAPLREAIRANKGELMRRVAFWQALTETRALPEDSGSVPWSEECFITACDIFRDAQTREALAARWGGLRAWLSGELPGEAMVVLLCLLQTLEGE